MNVLFFEFYIITYGKPTMANMHGTDVATVYPGNHDSKYHTQVPARVA